MRRVLLQLHRWVGLASGLYILIICLSGCLIVFRRELDRTLCPGDIVVTPSGRHIRTVCEPTFVSRLAEFHDHLSLGRSGLLFNGLGALVVMLMCLSGAILWWPGPTRWWRSLLLHPGVSPRRLLRDLHTVPGMWLLPLILLWCVTGLYFAYPALFNDLTDDAIAWVVRLHFGRAFGTPVETLWVILGLAPAGLVVTGVLMWLPRSTADGRKRADPSLPQTPARSSPRLGGRHD